MKTIKVAKSRRFLKKEVNPIPLNIPSKINVTAQRGCMIRMTQKNLIKNDLTQRGL